MCPDKRCLTLHRYSLTISCAKAGRICAMCPWHSSKHRLTASSLYKGNQSLRLSSCKSSRPFCPKFMDPFALFCFVLLGVKWCRRAAKTRQTTSREGDNVLWVWDKENELPYVTFETRGCSSEATPRKAGTHRKKGSWQVGVGASNCARWAGTKPRMIQTGPCSPTPFSHCALHPSPAFTCCLIVCFGGAA